MQDLRRRSLLIGGIALAALAPGSLIGCAGLGDSALPPEVSLLNLRPVRPAGLEQPFEVDLKFTNPNDFDLVVEGFTFQLEVNGTEIASGASDESVTLPRLGAAETSVIAAAPLMKLLMQMMSVIEQGHLEYRISGLAYVKGLVTRRVPYETAGKLGRGPAPAEDGDLVPI